MDSGWTFFSFAGRANRLRYWGLALVSAAAPLLLMSLLLLAFRGVKRGLTISFDIMELVRHPLSFGFGDSFVGAGPVGTPLLYAIAAPLSVAAMWILTAGTVRRLHDRDKSGLWMLPFFVIPMVANEVDMRVVPSDAALAMGLTVFLISVWGCVETLFLRGSRGPNRFGADPLALPDTRPGWDQQSELQFVPHSAGPPPGPHVNRGYD